MEISHKTIKKEKKRGERRKTGKDIRGEGSETIETKTLERINEKKRQDKKPLLKTLQRIERIKHTIIKTVDRVFGKVFIKEMIDKIEKKEN